MRTSTATLAVASLIAILTASAPVCGVALAAPTQVNVRIEGRNETLFEGPILTEGHDVKASSDTTQRPCDAINPNDPANSAPGPTPTSASVDAMDIVGETFDGQWYPEYDDYFITRWGPDEQSPAAGAYWGTLVNNVYTNVGGCQYRLNSGDEVLWAYDAFAQRPLLALYPAGDTSGARPLTASAELGKPFAVEVLDYNDAEEEDPPGGPERTGSVPYAGAEVSPVRRTAKGFERVDTKNPATVRTDAQGKANIVFTEPGWHRIKATAVNTQGEEDAIRSNRLDVCVPPRGASDCSEPLPEDQVRTPPPSEAEGALEGEVQAPQREAASPPGATPPGASPPGATPPGASPPSTTPPNTNPPNTDPPHTAPPNATNQARLDSTVRYLQDVQGSDGGFGNADEEPSQDFSAWVALALAAAGINPQDQAQPGGVDAYDFLVAHAREALPNELCKPIVCTTSFERELLVVDASGTSPQDFGGFDLVAEILARQLSDGSFPAVPGGRGEVNDTVFAILALSPVEQPTAQDAVQRAAEWLIGAQSGDGSWSPLQAHAESGEVDMTGAAIEALNAAGRHDIHAQQKALDAQHKAFEYLHKAQESSGGFPQFLGEDEANVASSAWVAQGIWSAGENPETWGTSSGREPLAYMASLQQPDGHIRWKQSKELNGVWMTAYVAPAFAGQALPIPAVPRSVQSRPTSPISGSTTPTAQGTAEAGQGGQSSRPGSGVIAGGGGRGAPLFSRPQPQSRGRTPGGVRLLNDAHRQAAAQNTAHSSADIAPRNAAPTTSRPPAADRGQATPRTAGGANTSADASTIRDANTIGAPNTGGDASRGGQTGGRMVEGALIGTPTGTHNQRSLPPGAPGLHGAGAGGNQTPWSAIGIGGAILLLVLAGSQLERRRPQVILL
jgi:hypothetical protein